MTFPLHLRKMSLERTRPREAIESLAKLRRFAKLLTSLKAEQPGKYSCSADIRVDPIRQRSRKLATYLKRFGKPQEDSCDCGGGPENAAHVMVQCPLRDESRENANSERFI